MDKFFKIFLFIFILAGCSIAARHHLDSLYGEAKVRSRINQNPRGPDYSTQVKPILDSRCVVCHACYDAPCQLKLSSFEGIDRGASKKQVYLAERLLATDPTRLFIDASSTKDWRKKEFFPVLNERSSKANLAGSTFFQMLELKRSNDHKNTKILSSSYDLRLDRDQQCPKIEEFEDFSNKYPLWGMPYGFPKLTQKEHQTLREWIENGAVRKPVNIDYQNPEITKWENFLNGKSKKEKLMSRYIYEHIFLGSLHFKNYPKLGNFRLIRSKTEPGKPIKIIATRRPYDYPGKKFYYRLMEDPSSISVKTYMPYDLDDVRMARWRELFLDPDYIVKKLPKYDEKISANPFKTFSAIPPNSRYRFMLDETEFMVMGFIKGPVCRGNTALNVIEDRFWVMFINPNLQNLKTEVDFLAEQQENLSLPTAESSNALVISTWLKYSTLQKNYLKAKEEKIKKIFSNSKDRNLNLIWDGDGQNDNVALTVFRHNDAASVVKGFVGDTPKTAWIMGYTLLERIHYLLVAGFDIYGNVGHQLNSRLFMDFMRMEGEYNFLSLLPMKDRIKERNFWYRDADKGVLKYLTWGDENPLPGVNYEFKTKNHKAELLSLVKKHLAKGLSRKFDINSRTDTASLKLKSLSNVHGKWVSLMPSFSLIRINSPSSSAVYSIILDAGYSNVSTPFHEEDRRLPKEDKIVIANGIAGSYPNVFFDVELSKLDDFIKTVKEMKSEKDYEKMLDKFGIRRSNKDFWAFSDWIHAYFSKTQTKEAGLLDYNRYENR